MRVRRPVLQVLIVVALGAFAGTNALIYGGILIGENAINVQKVSASSRGAAPPAQGVPKPSTGASAAATTAIRAESDDSPDLPGRFVPTQGRQHLSPYPYNARVPFCDAGQVSDSCYASNPPTSGLHLPVQGIVRLADGHRLKLPPDPDIYDFAIPREVIPHIEEHAGVYIGYNCSSDPCRAAVERLKDLVAQENSLGARVVMSPDPDLDDDMIGMAAWTRVDDFEAGDYSDARAHDFIKAHSCRFDPEHFCPAPTIN